MAALDPQKILIDAWWSVAQARPGFTSRVEPKNRIKTADAGYMGVVAARTLPADFPCVFVFGTGESTTAVSTFRTDETGGPDYGVPMTLKLDVVVAFDFTKDAALTPLEAEISAINKSLATRLRTAGHRWVGSITESKRREIKTFVNPVNKSKTLRTVATWTLTAACRPKRSLLIAQ